MGRQVARAEAEGREEAMREEWGPMAGAEEVMIRDQDVEADETPTC